MQLSKLNLALTRIGKASFSPKSLFSSGAQGAWYDPSDYSTMFEDAAGTTPITTPLEKPVGLMLDKSKGLVLGPELVTNGTFDTDTGWTESAGVTITGGKLVFTSAISGYAYQTQSISATATYVAKITIDSISSGSITIRLGSANSVSSTAITTAGTYTFYLFGRTGIENYIQILGGASSTTATIDNYSVKQLPGNHAYQSTSTSRPLISARYNLLTKTEAFSDAVWAQSASSGVVTKGTTTGTKPDGTSGTIDTITFPVVSAGGNAFQYQNCGQTLLNIQSTFSIYAKVESGTATVFINCEDIGAAPSGGNYFGSSAQTLTTTWQKLTLTGTRTSNTGNQIVMIGFDTRVSGSQTNAAPITIQVWGADLRVANDGVNLPSYQRVNTSTDYDYAGFPPYLKFDGTDDSLVTNSIDFSATDKMSVFAGVRKLSDAARGLVVELSDGSVPGIFNVSTARITNDINFGLNGSNSTSYSATTFASPISAVISCVFDIAGAYVSTEIFPRINSAIPSLSGSGLAGTGNFSNNAFYIGRRGGSTLPLNGRIYSLVVVGKLASASEITSTENWIEAKTFGKDMNYVYSDEVLTAASEQITTADGQNVYMTVTYQ